MFRMGSMACAGKSISTEKTACENHVAVVTNKTIRRQNIFKSHQENTECISADLESRSGALTNEAARASHTGMASEPHRTRAWN